jgi:hypothetical protein
MCAEIRCTKSCAAWWLLKVWALDIVPWNVCDSSRHGNAFGPDRRNQTLRRRFSEGCSCEPDALPRKSEQPGKQGRTIHRVAGHRHQCANRPAQTAGIRFVRNLFADELEDSRRVLPECIGEVVRIDVRKID